jgi:aubergine-like protein
MENKKGSGGTPFQALANYFNLESRIENWKLNQYVVKFNPPEDDTKAKKRMVRTLAPQIGENLFDGSMLFTIKWLSDPCVHTVKNERNNDKTHQVKIEFAREVPAGDWQWLQLMNILLRKIFELMELQMVGRDFYDPKAKVEVKQYRLQIWPGYKTSIRQHEYGPLMCVDQGFKILRTDTALDQMRTTLKSAGSNFKSAVTKLLLGQIVITRYNNKTYRIDDIAWNRNIMEEFDYRGKRISIAEYIWEKYKIKLTDKQQPLLISNPNAQPRRSGITEPIPLVPEACNMTGLDDGQRADFRLMAEVAKTTRTAPPERVAALQKFSTRLKGLKEVDDELAKWDLKFGNVCQFKGRTLPPEQLISGPKSKITSYKEDNAEWNGMFRYPYQLYGPTTCTKWAVVYNQRDRDSVQSFLKMLGQSASKMGYNLNQPLEKPVPDYKGATYQGEMIPILQKKPDLIMVVIQTDLYAVTKKLCVVKHPTPSQVVTAKLLQKPKGLESVAMKVAMQMACKLGGEPWIVKLPQVTGLMVIGYDTWHKSTQKDTSVGGFVASTNPTLSRFFSQCTFHQNNEELCNNMKACLAQAVQIYQKENGALPQRIVFYRDGVGAGQEENVRAQEVEQIKLFFKEKGMNVKFTFIIVAKRINTRFYKKQGAQFVNPPSGSVFDDVVTLPERYDFFIVSQSVRQGTVNPTSYNVIEDNSLWSPDIIQKLTYKLTHLYYNWPGVVKVPMVCQYAHKLAFLIGESVHARPHDAQQELLYYL